MTRIRSRGLLPAAAGIALLLTLPARAHAQAAPPRRVIVDSVPLRLPAPPAPSPATHRPSAVPVALRAATAPVILPPAPGGTPLDTAARRRAQFATVGAQRLSAAGAPLVAPSSSAAAVSPGVATAAVPAPLARPVPQQRVRAQSAARQVDATEARPAGATMRCKDGSYLAGTASSARCDNNAGVAVIYETRLPPPQRRP